MKHTEGELVRPGSSLNSSAQLEGGDKKKKKVTFSLIKEWSQNKDFIDPRVTEEA